MTSDLSAQLRRNLASLEVEALQWPHADRREWVRDVYDLALLADGGVEGPHVELARVVARKVLGR